MSRLSLLALPHLAYLNLAEFTGGGCSRKFYHSKLLGNLRRHAPDSSVRERARGSEGEGSWLHWSYGDELLLSNCSKIAGSRNGPMEFMTGVSPSLKYS